MFTTPFFTAPEHQARWPPPQDQSHHDVPLPVPAPPAGSPGKASQACRQCRRLKRKCGRELPSCSLCIRLGKTCEFPAHRKPYGSSAAATDTRPLASESASSIVTSSAVFPDAFFLDPEHFSPVLHSALRTAQPIPEDVLGLLGPDPDAICDPYFASIDTWFPFVSRKRLAQGVKNNKHADTAGIALLLLCMKLVVDVPHQPHNTSIADSALYRAARTFVNAVEEVSPASLPVMQAHVLIGLYEIGHGIFPAAYLTVGRAGRLGVLMGAHDRKGTTQLYQTAQTWTYWEEQRRTWWAVMILDRYINLGPSGLPFATPEPAPGELLPTPDNQWRVGTIGINQALFTTGFDATSEIGPFARLCQASHILGRVLRHRDSRKEELGREFVLTEALQLAATLKALDKHLSRPMDDTAGSSGTSSSASSSRNTNSPHNSAAGSALGLGAASTDADGDSRIIDSQSPSSSIGLAAGLTDADAAAAATMTASTADVALCTSARLTLFNMYACNEPDVTAARLAEEAAMQRTSLDGIKQVAGRRAAVLARTIVAQAQMPAEPGEGGGGGGEGVALGRTSPFVLQVLYHAATECQWFIKEGGDFETPCAETLALLLQALEVLSRRWVVAEKYLELLRAAEEQ